MNSLRLLLSNHNGWYPCFPSLTVVSTVYRWWGRTRVLLGSPGEPLVDQSTEDRALSTVDEMAVDRGHRNVGAEVRSSGPFNGETVWVKYRCKSYTVAESGVVYIREVEGGQETGSLFDVICLVVRVPPAL